MLRVWNLSGEELAAMTMEGLSDVKNLKLELRALHGHPVSMQQLMHGGASLEDATKLDSPMDLQLVILLAGAQTDSDEVAEELVSYAAAEGHVCAPASESRC